MFLRKIWDVVWGLYGAVVVSVWVILGGLIFVLFWEYLELTSEFDLNVAWGLI